MAGSKVWDRQCKFRVCVGPLTWVQYESFLPGGRSLPVLRDWVRQFAGLERQWALRLALKASRCSRTLRLGKTCRPSGTSASPSRAMRSAGQPVMSWPAKRMRPALGCSQPHRQRSSVLLPMPLRPSSVATSPDWMVRFMPNSTWLAP